jgi:glycine/D-amino acid oxidase-like deaminating enzyme
MIEVFYFLVFLLQVSSFSLKMSSKDYKVAVIGGGIHGASIAYYLSTRFSISSIVVEQTSVACAASGKAGGFLARTRGHGPTVELHEKSFELHRELAATLKLESYRSVKTLSIDGSSKGSNIPKWLDRKVSSKLMDEDTAQVTPLELTTKLLEAAALDGKTQVMIDKVTGVNIEDTQVKSIVCEKNGVIHCDAVVVAMGPWSGETLLQ